MHILGPEALVYGVEDIAAAATFCAEFGLLPLDIGAARAIFETQDGSVVTIRSSREPDLPPAIEDGPTVREVIWGVADQDVIDQIRAELSCDRQVDWDGERLHTRDDMGLGIAFQVSRKRSFDPVLPAANIPGHFQRKVNTRIDFARDVRPLGIAHIVLNCADEARTRAFYIDRLGFRLSDEFTGAGAFIRTSIAREHHSLFTVQRVPAGLNHIAFYVTDFHDVMLGGKAMTDKGWRTRMGPGRHKLGSNYFWYFDSPLGSVEYTCDVDHVDDDWVPGHFDFSPDMVAIWSAKDFPAL